MAHNDSNNKPMQKMKYYNVDGSKMKYIKPLRYGRYLFIWKHNGENVEMKLDAFGTDIFLMEEQPDSTDNEFSTDYEMSDDEAEGLGIKPRRYKKSNKSKKSKKIKKSKKSKKTRNIKH